ncbi:ATP-binding protein [Aquabacterium sp. J223]|uniref:hybrid sensor histidine kinase/response regulator n=1 Tax=Aquabacterium sp. J223 TaxID=2898431 RepID=UPI0021AD8C16|nr:ATP-binding protein [Aquabacterium sp. J223]UUX95106.1 ATP-binding protein [Aquabacterium sp. J223]
MPGETLPISVLDHHPDPVLRLRRDAGPAGTAAAWRCAHANPAAAALLGQPEAKGMALVALVGERPAAALADALHGDGPVRLDLRLDDGRRLRGQALPDGEGGWLLLLSPAEDPELSRLQAELAQRSLTLETLLEVVPVPIIVAQDPEGRQVVRNRAAVQLLTAAVAGTGPSIVTKGPPVSLQFFQHGQPLPLARFPLRRALQGEEVRDEPFELRLPDGRQRHIHVCAAPLYDPAGRIRGAVNTFVDISEPVRAEQRVRELLLDATRASQAKDHFLATLAHELRNPLAPIRNAVHVLQRGGIDEPERVRLRAVIERQIGHLARLLEDLLDVSRIGRQRLELRREPVDLHAVVDVALETSRPPIEAGGHRLSVHVSEAPLPVVGDAVRLAQVLTNLLNNAAKYTPPGGRIELHARADGDDVVLRVRDDGMGIEPSMLEQVFELFSQTESARERAQGGLGIGLSLVRAIVELHGGSVRAHSAGLQRGSEFVVRLPMAPAKPPVAAAATPAPGWNAVAGAGDEALRVLVVDDNRDNTETLTVLLQTAGCRARGVCDGQSALDLVDGFRPQVVLLDLGMPGLDGLEVCRRLRRRPDGAAMRIVAMTGWGGAEDLRRTREAGFDLHLVKPVAVEALLAALRVDG